jgi:superfamily II DNA or RNA helicase
MGKTLRPHIIEAVVELNKADKGIINLPTGTGKSLIQAHAIVGAISLADKPGVYVIASPRILLSNQLLETVRELLIERHIDCQYLCVRSGEAKDFGEAETLSYEELTATTSSDEIRVAYTQAQQARVPLVISAVYDSMIKLDLADLPIDITHCDEAHYLIQSDFAWIPTDFTSKKKYFYTATLRVTKSDEGLGMNNEDRFGPVLYQKSPEEMVKAGEIVKPRINIVHTSAPVTANNVVNPVAIVEAFLEHASLVKLGAKMLVTTTNSKSLEALVSSRDIALLRRQRPRLTIFDISSKHEPRINGQVVDRNDFLELLRDLDDRDEALIFHIDILTEGIDVPGITGVMMLTDLGPAKFLQTLGRATRLHPDDRERLYAGEIKPTNVFKMIKPVAWIVVPFYGKTVGEEWYDSMVEMVTNLQTFGFDVRRDVIVVPTLGPMMGKVFTDIVDQNDAVGDADRIMHDQVDGS